MRWIRYTVTVCFLCMVPITLAVQAGQTTHKTGSQTPSGTKGNPTPTGLNGPVLGPQMPTSPGTTKPTTIGTSPKTTSAATGGKILSTTGTGGTSSNSGKSTNKGNPVQGGGTNGANGKGAVVKSGIVKDGKGATAWSHKVMPSSKNGPKMTSKDKTTIRALTKSTAVTPAESKALGKAEAGQPLSAQDRTLLSTLARDGREGITREDREAISRALDDDLERTKVSLSRRYLYLRNDTGQELTVSIVYQTLDSQKKIWHWVPEKPPTSQAVQVTLSPGAVLPAKHGSQPILAGRVRLWASSPSGGNWQEWKEQSLELVPEADEKGNRRYFASTHDTFTFRFKKQ